MSGPTGQGYMYLGIALGVCVIFFIIGTVVGKVAKR
jgi:hypothetical protein